MRWLVPLVVASAPVLLASCVTLTELPRALLLDSDRAVSVRALPCDAAGKAAVHTDPRAGPMLDPDAIRIVSWNIHKQADRGWQEDLTRFVAGNDVVLLQEVVLREALRDTLENAGLHWTMASSFLYFDEDIGVMTASRVPSLAACTARVVEPLLRLPKSSVVSWYPLRGSAERLAVVNVHAINFSLDLAEYRAQFAQLADSLATHRGPIVFAGDLNTWTKARSEVVQDAARRLGVREIGFDADHRSLFLGRQLDHILVRGLDVIAAEVIRVDSSDHNPVRATLRVAGRTR